MFDDSAYWHFFLRGWQISCGKLSELSGLLGLYDCLFLLGFLSGFALESPCNMFFRPSLCAGFHHLALLFTVRIASAL